MVLWNWIADFFTLPKDNQPTNEIHERALYTFLSKEGAADFNVIDSSGWSPI